MLALIIECVPPGAGGCASAGSGSRSSASPSWSVVTATDGVPGAPSASASGAAGAPRESVASSAGNVGVSTALVAGDARSTLCFLRRPPVARIATSLAGRPAARLLMIFLSAL